jgi:hypothetical protein
MVLLKLKENFAMYPKTFFATSQIKTRAGKCFVAMPFSSAFDEVYETIREAIEGPELSLTCSRADELEGGGHIIEDILREIAESEIVIADLTGRNPNVFYELGIAQMVKNVEKVILLSQDVESVPFDVRVFRCIIYKQTIHGAKQLKDALIAGIRAVAEKSFRFKLHQGGNYKFPQKVMGPEHCAYDFEIVDCFFAVDGAKFMLCVTQYAAGQAPRVTFQGGYGLGVGEKRELPGLDWDLELESVSADLASLLVQRRRITG